jgi:hypothetical protein
MFQSPIERARFAKGVVRDLLNRPSWGRGVGIGCAALLAESWAQTSQQPCVPAVYVMVQTPSDVARARSLIGDTVYGVTVVIEAVGNIVAQW